LRAVPSAMICINGDCVRAYRAITQKILKIKPNFAVFLFSFNVENRKNKPYFKNSHKHEFWE